MRYRHSSGAYRDVKHAFAISQGHRSPEVVEIVHHQSNRYQAIVLLGYSTYVLSTSTYSRSTATPNAISLGGAYRGSQVHGTQLIHACHAAYGQPYIGNDSLRSVPRSPSNRYFIGRVLSWTDLLHKGVNTADTITEGAGLVRCGEEFLNQIARAAHGAPYNKTRGNRLVQEVFYDILMPKAAQAYAFADAAFSTGSAHAELIANTLSRPTTIEGGGAMSSAGPSPTDEIVAGTYIGNWQLRSGILVPPVRDLQPAQIASVAKTALHTYQQFSRGLDAQVGPLSAKPAVLAKNQGESVIQYIASNETSQSQSPSKTPSASESGSSQESVEVSSGSS